jgi:hypothetical protein
MPCPCTGRSAQRHCRRWSAATGSRTRVLRRSRRLRSRTELLRACVPWSYSPPLPGIANTPSGHPKQFVEMMSQFGGFPCGRRASEVFGLSCLIPGGRVVGCVREARRPLGSSACGKRARADGMPRLRSQIRAATRGAHLLLGPLPPSRRSAAARRATAVAGPGGG